MILRVIVDDRLGSGSACPWVVVAADGRALRHGTSSADAWPAAERVEGVLPAAHARLVAVTLPALSRNRLDRAAAYAIEDQLAAPIEASAIAAAPGIGGATLVAVADAAQVARIAAAMPRMARLVPEAALAPPGSGWTWYRSGAGGGFVRRADGSSFAVASADATGALPSELEAALALARLANAEPAGIDVAFEAPAAMLARWSEATAVPFAPAAAWRWQDAAERAWRDAPDLLLHRDAGARDASQQSPWRALRVPALLVTAALAVHVTGLAIEWAALAVERWQASGALVALAQQARVPASGDAETVAAALARHHHALLRRAGKQSPAGALSLLARAAAPLATLPHAAVTEATYAGDTWTLTLTGVDGKALEELVVRLRDAGIDALAVPGAAGTRLRLALDPAAS
jgi:type II secretory pathway component PulL